MDEEVGGEVTSTAYEYTYCVKIIVKRTAGVAPHTHHPQSPATFRKPVRFYNLVS